MLYALEQGPTEQTIIRQALLQGNPLPQAIRNAPDLALGLGLFYVAFEHLNSCRQIGFDEGPISWFVINEYCKQERVTGDQKEAMFYLIRAMDNAYLKYREGKRKKK